MIVGIDEVGRGCLAGPLVAGAVVLKEPISGLRDSKKLTKFQREKLDVIIRQQAAAIGLGWVTPGEIDERGLTWAVSAAMSRALAEITYEYDEIIIDGNINYLAKNDIINDTINDINISTLVGADDKVPCVSAASIIAKVARDNYMVELADSYKNYGFEKHVGYGTKAHLLALAKYGASDIHRKSFTPVSRVANQMRKGWTLAQKESGVG